MMLVFTRNRRPFANGSGPGVTVWEARPEGYWGPIASLNDNVARDIYGPFRVLPEAVGDLLNEEIGRYLQATEK